eukprot:180340-Prymnesium_polylepis.1
MGPFCGIHWTAADVRNAGAAASPEQGTPNAGTSEPDLEVTEDKVDGCSGGRTNGQRGSGRCCCWQRVSCAAAGVLRLGLRSQSA